MRVRLMAAAALIPLLAACGASSSGGASGGDGTIVDGSGVAGGGSGVAASCIAPTLTAKPTKVQAGDKIHVTGEWFAGDCNDTGQGDPPAAVTGMTIDLLQDGHSWPVARGVDATGDHYAFDVTITVPDDVKPGAAKLQVKDYGFPADLEVAPS